MGNAERYVWLVIVCLVAGLFYAVADQYRQCFYTERAVLAAAVARADKAEQEARTLRLKLDAMERKDRVDKGILPPLYGTDRVLWGKE